MKTLLQFAGIGCMLITLALRCEESRQPPREPRINMSVALGNKDYRLGEPITISLKFENLTKKKLRFSEPRVRCVIRHDGEELKAWVQIGEGLIDLWEVAPGASRTMQKDARRSYIFPPNGGEFELSVFWEVDFLTEDGSFIPQDTERGLFKTIIFIKPANQTLQPTAPSRRG